MRCNILSNYTAKNQAQVLEKILSNISEEYLKMPGTFTYDFSNAVAILAQEYELEIEEIWNYFNIDNLTGEILEQRTQQLKGISRKAGTRAVGELTVTGNGTINIGDLFETVNAVQFRATETKKITDVGTVKIEAVLTGDIGNVGAKSITLMPVTIQGIKTVTNNKATYDGFEEESDTSLKERYYIAVRTPATSGNMYHYKQWSREVVGVGDSKVFPLWNGRNTVKVVIIDSNRQPASSELVKKVQEYIDPMGEDDTTWGAGYGTAPIGAYCTVISAQAKNIDIEVRIVKETGAELETVKEIISNNVTEFLKTIAFQKDYVSYSLIANTILESAGVAEWVELKVNNGTNNVDVGVEEVAVLNTVNVYE